MHVIHTCTKRFGPISVAHRQWRSDTHCSFIHGYGREVEITFGARELDEKGWVVDFGSLREVKAWLEREWDHRLLVAHDDPYLAALQQMHSLGVVNLNVMSEEFGPGIEDSCRYILAVVDAMVREKTNGRCWVDKVQTWEHRNNSASCINVSSKMKA